ncbi:hypothetical protein UCDDS831_g08016 [Diplodia seriata]|uniref:ribonuclease T1 n=1 Tax=Diplodia seriata TaxID=420778 RepID=A0A0G2DVR4_9PEZI|nr:hypothetical protein UCDDS831_g08016 [Diplodia seriata]
MHFTQALLALMVASVGVALPTNVERAPSTTDIEHAPSSTDAVYAPSGHLSGAKRNTTDAVYVEIDKRAPATAVKCEGPNAGSQTFDANAVKSATNAAKKWLGGDGKIKTGGPNGYPHYYGGNNISLPAECKGKKLAEFPLGKDNKTDRVVLAFDGKGWSYCFTMTHRGRSDNEFRICPAA